MCTSTYVRLRKDGFRMRCSALYGNGRRRSKSVAFLGRWSVDTMFRVR